jgi:Holliday junction DNA helicase RuvA
MYDHLLGTIYSKQPTTLVLRTQGVGYSLHISLSTYDALPNEGEECLIYTHLQVREDAHVLFGFLSKEERLLFLKLTSVSGIGPITGIRIMSGASVDQLITAIQTGNTALLSKVKGIGKKTAERLVLELAATIGTIKFSTTSTPSISNLQKDAVAALITLGYSEKDALFVVQGIVKEKPSAGLDLIIREALKVI